MRPFGRMLGRRRPRRQSPMLLHRLIPQLAPVAAVAGPDRVPDFYGTGIGQVRIRLRPQDATVDANGMVQTVPNVGGGGSAFDATGKSTTNQLGPSTTQRTPRGFVNTGTHGGLLLDTPLDLTGHRLYLVAEFDHETANHNLAGYSVGTADGQRTNFQWITSAPQRLVAERWHGTGMTAERADRGSSLGTTRHLVEIEVLPTTGLTLWVDGVRYPGDGAWDFAEIMVQRLMWGHLAVPFVGAMREIDIVPVNATQAAQNAAAAVRLAIADHHGIALDAGAVLEGLRGSGDGQIVLDFDAAVTVDNAGVPVTVPNLGGLGSAYDATIEGSVTKPDAATLLLNSGSGLAWAPFDAAGYRIFWVANRSATGQAYVLGGTLDGTNVASVRLLHGTNTPEGVLTSNYSASYTGTSNSAVNSVPRAIGVRSLSEFESGPQRLAAGVNGDVRLGASGRSNPFPLGFFGKTVAGATPTWTGNLQRLMVVKPMGDLVAFDQNLARIRSALLAKYPPA